MARTTRWTLWAAAAVTLIGAAACNDSQSPRPRALLGLPDVGTLAVTVTTSGSNTPSGYTVIVDGSSSQSVGATGVATFLGLPSGSHTVLLSGVPSNCSVSGDNPRTVSLIAGLVAATTFSVSCTAPPPPPTTGDLTVTTGTSGSNIDADGYTVTVDGNASKSIGTNGSVTFTGLSAASHTVVLSGVASNCSVSGGPSRTVSVPADGTASTSFSVSCTAPPPQTGNLTVTTSTTGSNLDPDGYTATVDGGASQAIGTNGSVTFSGLSAASHTVVLSGVASNCSVTGGMSRTVSVPAGGTASTSFSVSCTAPPPETGNLTVTASTTGSNLDPDGYTATVDGGASQSVGTNGSVTFTGLSAGSHSVALSGLAANCSVSGANPQTVTVPSGGTATATFAVSCAATGGGNGTLTVTTSTTGSDLDPDGYTVTLDGGATSQPIATNGSVSFTGPAGDHTVALSGMAGNCSVSGANPRTVTVPSGGTVSTTFSVTCAATGGGTGSLTVITSTTGSNLDPDGYTITIDGSFSQPIGTNASVTFTGPSGDHTLALSGVASNCSVSGANPRTVTVPSGGTTSTTFSVSCAATGGGGGSGEVIGQGQIGNGSPTLGSDATTFNFDVRSDFTGRFTASDYADVHGDHPASLTTDPVADPATSFTAYRNSSSACSDPTRGVEVDAVGREDTGNLVGYTLTVCDNGPAGSGDLFDVFLPSEGFRVSGPVTSGDISKR
ncbi:MAG TPA: hypothetical protein VKH16_09200 [Gemmatimonadales bacterium]|nr:hypothetical protein [Gemmatimonadales bacterium]